MPAMDQVDLAEIRSIEAARDFANPRYAELLDRSYYVEHIMRLPLGEWPEPVNFAFATMNYDLYLTMRGPSEMGMWVEASLAEWDRTGDFHFITTPTLVLGGRHDTMDPSFLEMMAAQIPNGSSFICERGSQSRCTTTRRPTSGPCSGSSRRFLESTDRKCETRRMSERMWSEVDEYLVQMLLPPDDALADTIARSEAAQLPAINVAANQGKMLELLARMQRARRILEIGTLGGYSTIWLARALDGDGTLVTLELEPRHARVARENVEGAGLGSVVDIRVGPATESLRAMIDAGDEPFDFIFIDADKEGYPRYLALSLELSRPGTVIVADNVVRDGEVADPTSTDERVVGVRAFLEMASADGRIEGTAVQTVGTKGYDGFALLMVTR